MKIIAGIWFLVVVTAMVAIANYSNTPGHAEEAPSQWPAQSHIALDGQRSTLLMFVHPHCPCSQASVSELERLLASCQDRLSARVVFIHPPGTTEAWVDTDLWRRVAAIPGVTALRDDDSREAKLFQAETSGFTVLYDPRGRLQFAGGITLARGHEGDNPGRSAIANIVKQGLPSQIKTPVFGCSLFGTECKPAISSLHP
jgi:hypothetical protein